MGDLDELKRKDYPEVKKLTLGDKKVSKGMIVIFTNSVYSDQGITNMPICNTIVVESWYIFYH